MENWKSRFLTPFGRITLIKTLFLPKLIHLIMLLPVPNVPLQEINNLMYELLWDSKPDKVKRKTICAECSKGGLRMTDIFNFEKVLKLSGICKTFWQTNTLEITSFFFFFFKQKMYFSFIKPILEYGDVFSKLYSIEITAMRLVSGAPHRSNIKSLYIELGW